MIRRFAETDDPSGFSCGVPELDEYLRRFAFDNGARGVGVTYVHLDCNSKVNGFVTLTTASVRAQDSSALRDFPSYPLPVLLVARLAVDSESQGAGIGRKLLRFAIEEAAVLRERTGCVGLVVDAKPAAALFYERFGFERLRAATSGTGIVRMCLEWGAILEALG